MADFPFPTETPCIRRHDDKKDAVTGHVAFCRAALKAILVPA